MESLSLCSRSPSTILVKVVAAAQQGTGSIVVTAPAAARCVSVTTMDGAPCTQWRIERTDGLWHRVVVHGMKRVTVVYFMTPVIDQGSIFVMVPPMDGLVATADIVYNTIPFTISIADGSLLKLSPVPPKMSPMLLVVAAFVGLVLVTLMAAFLL